MKHCLRVLCFFLLALASFQHASARDTVARVHPYMAVVPPSVDSEDSNLLHFRVYTPLLEQNEAARINARYFERLAAMGSRAPDFESGKPVFCAGALQPVYGARNDLGCLSTCYDLLFRCYLF